MKQTTIYLDDNGNEIKRTVDDDQIEKIPFYKDKDFQKKALIATGVVVTAAVAAYVGVNLYEKYHEDQDSIGNNSMGIDPALIPELEM